MKKNQKNSLQYLNSFKVNHNVFDEGLIKALDLTKINIPQLPYLLSCIYTIIQVRLLTGVVILGTFSNWMLPFLPRSKRCFYVVHNNLDRRFKEWLKFRQKQLILTNKRQKSYLANGHFIGHPVLKRETVQFKKLPQKVVLITDDITCKAFVENNISKDLLIKGVIGKQHITDLEDELKTTEYLIIDREYKLRTSSLVALGISFHCKVLVTCPYTSKSLNDSFGTDKINYINNWQAASPFNPLDVDTINSKFSSNLEFIAALQNFK